MRPSRLLVLPIVAVTALAVVPPAMAGTGTTDSRNGVLFAGCRDHAWSWSLQPEETDWRLDATLVDPDGAFVATAALDSTDDETTGTADFVFCGGERAGTYTIAATLTEYRPNGDVASTTQLPDSTFRMRNPRSRTRLRVSDTTPHFDEIVRFRVVSRAERPGGFRRAAGAVTKLQYRTREGWVNQPHSRNQANDRGVSIWRYRWNVTRTYRVRAVTLRSPDYKRSASRRVVIDQRRGGRVVTPRRTTGRTWR